MKKYRNPLRDCGMYINNMYFYFVRQKSCPCSNPFHGILFLGLRNI